VSAFVVGKTHIDYLIEAGLQFGERFRVTWTDPKAPVPAWTGSERAEEYFAACRANIRELNETTADRVGAMLWAENHRSVSYRYSEAQATPAYEFLYRFPKLGVDPVVVLRAIACLAYQSNETPDWQLSEASAFLDALRDAAITHLPGYDTAPWEISNLTEAQGARAA
jgi:hypothetical protein